MDHSARQVVLAVPGVVDSDGVVHYGAEDSADVITRFANGGMAESMNRWAVAGGRDVRAGIYGTSGTIHLDKARGEGGILAFSQHGYGPALEVEAGSKPHVSSDEGWHFPTPDPRDMHGHAYVAKHFLEVVGNDTNQCARCARAGVHWSGSRRSIVLPGKGARSICDGGGPSPSSGTVTTLTRSRGAGRATILVQRALSRPDRVDALRKSKLVLTHGATRSREGAGEKRHT